MKTKFNLKPSVLCAAVVAAVAVAGSPAYALEAKISGQINRALMNVDDGEHTETFNVDNDNSSTRVRFTGSENIGSGLKAGIVWEVEFQSNDSDKVSQNTPTLSQGGFGERKMEVYFQGAFGKASLGQGDGAMNGGIERDLSGTSVISYAGTGDMGGAIEFRDSTGALTGNTIRGRLNQQDFESRYDRLRYDTPSLGPIVLSASTGYSSSDDVVEYGARLSTKYGGGGKIIAALGLSNKKADSGGAGTTGGLTETETVGGSVSILLPGGLNFTLATSTKEIDPGTPGSSTTEGDFTYFKVGYKAGQHAISLDIANGEDQGGTAGIGDEADHIGIQYVWSPKKWAELFAGYKTVEFDDNTATSFNDLDFITIGSRLKF